MTVIGPVSRNPLPISIFQNGNLRGFPAPDQKPSNDVGKMSCEDLARIISTWEEVLKSDDTQGKSKDVESRGYSRDAVLETLKLYRQWLAERNCSPLSSTPQEKKGERQTKRLDDKKGSPEEKSPPFDAPPIPDTPPPEIGPASLLPPLT